MDLAAAIKKEIQGLRRDGNGTILLTVAVGWGLLLGTRMIYPVILPHLRTTYELDLSTAGLLITILWLGSAIGQLPSGILADRYSERKVMTASTILASIAIILVISSPTAFVLYAATGVLGLGLSLYPIARITILSHVYPERIGSALGVTMATGDIGQTVLPPLAGFLAAGFAWELGLGYVIPFILLTTIGIWITVPQHSTPSSVDAMSRDNTKYILSKIRQPNILLMTLILLLFIFIWQSFSAFYPTYLVEEKDLTATTAAGLFGVFFACGVVVKPIAGSAYDRIGMRLSLIIILLGPVLGFILLPLSTSIMELLLVTITVSSMLGSGAITQSYLADSFPADMRGTGLGAIRTTAATIGAMGPVAFGIIAEAGFFDEGYYVLAFIMIAVILLIYKMPAETPAT